MEAKKAKKNKVRGIKNAFIVIIICFIVALVVFTQVLGAPENFEGGDPAGGHPLNLLGTIYKGGFIVAVKAALEKGDIAGAQALCDKQRGTVASVVSSALIKYSEVEKDDTLSKEQKIEAIKKQLEEAAALEMPSMQQNLPIVATMTTLGTLVGLLPPVLLTLWLCRPVFRRHL